MTIVLEGHERIRLTAAGGAFAFDADGASLSPFHLLAGSLATCTYAVLLSWAEQAGLAVDGLELVVEWELGGEPFRVTEMRLGLVWPALPPERREAARRVAAHCTVHSTLEHPTHVETTVTEAAQTG